MIDPYDAHIHLPGNSHSPLRIFGINWTGQAVVTFVGDTQSFLFVLELQHRDYRAKDLFSGDPHISCDACEEVWLRVSS